MQRLERALEFFAGVSDGLRDKQLLSLQVDNLRRRPARCASARDGPCEQSAAMAEHGQSPARYLDAMRSQQSSAPQRVMLVDDFRRDDSRRDPRKVSYGGSGSTRSGLSAAGAGAPSAGVATAAAAGGCETRSLDEGRAGRGAGPPGGLEISSARGAGGAAGASRRRAISFQLSPNTTNSSNAALEYKTRRCQTLELIGASSPSLVCRSRRP